MQINTPPITVSELNRQVRQYLEYEIGETTVIGELSNFKQHSSGHIYFTLKDSIAQARCVFFRNAHNLQSSLCKEGDQVIVQGLVSLYEGRGDYQLIIKSLQLHGQGDLFRQYEMLKQKLEKEGIFATNHKQTLPTYPKAIGLITSPTGAALQDMLATLTRRYPLVHVYLYPCEVQGKAAAPQLINALQQANNNPCCDVIILARGGGSLEDLWAFNDETLVRTIYASILPVITGIGHETDFTLADFAADLRAATPTAAAEASTPNLPTLQQYLHTSQQRLIQAIRHLIAHSQYIIEQFTRTMRSPDNLIKNYMQRLDQILLNLIRTINQHISLRKANLTQQAALLQAVSPLAILGRGYAIPSYKQQIIHTIDQVNTGDQIEIQLSKGVLQCAILDKFN